MRQILFLVVFSMSALGYGQPDDKMTTIDFVQILNNNKDEAVYYYSNNWKVLREMAQERNYIASFQILETPFSEVSPFHFMLITTYADSYQYESREAHFEELIKEKGALRLMNEKQPNEFRKTLFSKEGIRHWK